jgi:catechol 2,3-dioxygenase-like lactoylglutathione lyase family enzyme
MIVSGNATVNVANLNAAIRFYTDSLGFKLTNRLGDRWATIDAGPSYWTTEGVNAGLVLGLRPAAAQSPPPGTAGGVGFGFETYRRVEDVAATLKKRGVRTEGEIVAFEAGRIVAFVDLDGVPSYAWEFSEEMLSEVDAESRSAMAAAGLLSGGHAIVYVSNMDAAIRFYADTLGLNLTYRFENKFATVEVGRNLLLALHPQTPNTPIPGTKGSVTLGLVVDEPLDVVLSRLAQRGVRMTGRSDPSVPRAESSDRWVDIEDLDGNVITLWEAQALTRNSDLAAPGVPARR